MNSEAHGFALFYFDSQTLPDTFFVDPAHRAFLSKESRFSFNIEHIEDLPVDLKISIDKGRKSKVILSFGKSKAKIKLRLQADVDIFIGNSVAGRWQITAFADSKILIKDGCTSRGLTIVNCGYGNYFELGQDAMLAEDIRLNVGDQHAIFDRQNGHIINNKKASFICKEHVWLGYGCLGMVSSKSVIIGKGSIIGARSIITRSIPDFTLAVGSPAKVIKKMCLGHETGIQILNT